MGDTWMDEEVIEEILKYFLDIPTPAHVITKLRTLIQGEEEAIVTYNQKYKTLVERVEGKPIEKIDSYIEMEQYLGSISLPIRKSIRNNIYWKSRHAPKTLGEAMRKAEELYMKHIYTMEGQMENNQNSTSKTEVIINEVHASQESRSYNHRPWKNEKNSEISPKRDDFQGQHRTLNEENRQLPRGSYTHILVNPTQLSDTEFTAWMDKLVEAR